MSGGKISEDRADKTVVHSGGEIFSDGTILELVRLPSGRLNFLVWNGKSSKMVEQFVRNDKTFVPLQVDPTILRSLRLPSDTVEYESTGKLFIEISNLLSRVTRHGGALVQWLTFFVFAASLVESLPFAPFLWVVASPAAAAPIAQVMNLLCRHALTVNNISPAGFRSLPMDLQPTLLTEVFQPMRPLLNLMRASSRHGALIQVRGKVVDSYCAKIVFAPEPLRDPASAGYPLELVLPPTGKYVPPMPALEAHQIAKEYQGKLLRYRLANRAKVRTPALDLSQFTVPIQELAYSLAASIVDDDEHQVQILPLLKPLDSQIRVDRASSLSAIVVEALLARCHGAAGNDFPVMDLTADVNTILCGRGESFEVSPEQIGWRLRALGLHTDSIPGGRKGLDLQNEVRKKIHDLAEVHGVRTLGVSSLKINCPMCAAMVYSAAITLKRAEIAGGSEVG